MEGGSEGGDSFPSVSAWRGSAHWRPGFSLLSHSHATPTLTTPQSRIPEGCQDLVLIPGAAPGPSLPCLGKAPCTSFWLLPRYACSPGGGSGGSGTQGCARKEAAGLREQPHCLCSAMCAKRFLANWEPLLLTLPLELPPLPSSWTTHLPSDNACNNSKGLELHKVQLVLRARGLSDQGLGLVLAPNGCAINQTYQRST